MITTDEFFYYMFFKYISRKYYFYEYNLGPISAVHLAGSFLICVSYNSLSNRYLPTSLFASRDALA